MQFSKCNVRFSKRAPVALLHKLLHDKNFRQKLPLFGQFVSRYVIKRLKFSTLGCFRGVEGTVKNLIFGQFLHPPKNHSWENFPVPPLAGEHIMTGRWRQSPINGRLLVILFPNRWWGRGRKKFCPRSAGGALIEFFFEILWKLFLRNAINKN